jgi:hypothetical protein
VPVGPPDSRHALIGTPQEILLPEVGLRELALQDLGLRALPSNERADWDSECLPGVSPPRVWTPIDSWGFKLLSASQGLALQGVVLQELVLHQLGSKPMCFGQR